MSSDARVRDRAAIAPWTLIGLLALALLLAQPELDLHWEHHPSHW